MSLEKKDALKIEKCLKQTFKNLQKKPSKTPEKNLKKLRLKITRTLNNNTPFLVQEGGDIPQLNFVHPPYIEPKAQTFQKSSFTGLRNKFHNLYSFFP